ncbi:MAG: pilus assembly protein, partial [Hyphomicrobiales bacterium]|nr:pilus assembly protein [Hyphomicrobiales bacterium]
TDIDAAMKFAGAQVATAYTTPRPPVNFVVLVSDGVQDKVDCNTTGTTSGGCRAYEPISLSTCNALKAAGDQVAVVYTPYLPITNNSWYNSYVAPINVQPVPASASLPQVTNVMKSCASDPSLFAETGPNTDIGTALKNIFENALARTLLTN